MNHFFAYINRMRFIQRWSLMRNSYTENIQEHSHQTAVLAHALAVLRNERFGGQVDVGAVAVAALYHDAGEILTGDMPTPIKYYNPGIREAYKAVEQVAEDKLLSMLPEALRPAYEAALRPADPEIAQLVRAADTLSGAEGRQHRVPSGRRPDRRRHGRHGPAGAGLFPRAFPAQLFADIRRIGMKTASPAPCHRQVSSTYTRYAVVVLPSAGRRIHRFSANRASRAKPKNHPKGVYSYESDRYRCG